MSSGLLVLGASHKTAPLALRERLALPEGRAAAILGELVSVPAIQEAVALSTCNRTELYVLASDTVAAESAALGVLARQAAIGPTELSNALYSLRDRDAVRHLFAVAAGLDSMVVGEAEIQGQVRRAHELATVEGASGPVTNRLFRDAIAAGKRVRSETTIGRRRVSVPSVAVELAAATLGDLSSRRVLVIGAGEGGELTARALRAQGVHTVFVANRRYDRAIGLARRFGGQAVRFDQLPAELVSADIVVSSTGSPHLIVGREELELVMNERDWRPLVIIDIAVPRDFDPEVRALRAITLFDMDDLQREVARNLRLREAERRQAATIVEEETERFCAWLTELDVLPTIAALRRRADALVAAVLAENEGRWESLSVRDRQRVEAMARALAKRLLHDPTAVLRRSAGSEDGYRLAHAVRELFQLDRSAGGASASDRENAAGAPAAKVERLTRRAQRGARKSVR